MSLIGIMLLFIGAAFMDSDNLIIPCMMLLIAMLCLLVGKEDRGETYDAE